MRRDTDMAHGTAEDFYDLVRGGLMDELGITATTSDENISIIAAKEFDEALEQGQVVTGIYTYLSALRDELAANDHEGEQS